MMQIDDPRVRSALLDQVAFGDQGFIAAIAQDHHTKAVLMLAWMDRDALDETLKTGQVVYYSRSRKSPWRKGETSGQTQTLVDIHLDCDRDAVLLSILQEGVACHTGRISCFSWQPQSGEWKATAPVMIDPSSLYGDGK